MTTHIFGIRHHGPGSAQALLAALRELQPDIVLVEGPADADPLLPWLDHALLEPPIALVMYRTDEPKRAAYFPFARFSPEYQAIRYAQGAGVPVSFMDLPQATVLALQEKFVPPDVEALQELARLAGFAGVEPWWNAMVEQRRDRREIFTAIMELMRAARTLSAPPGSAAAASRASTEGPTLNDRREAFMRTKIRAAQAAGHARIAIVCGAYHGPVLEALDRPDVDAALLADLPQAAVEGAWTPWTYGRLALASGYGSGIQSPGWYDHLWEQASRWDRELELGTYGATDSAALHSESSIVWLTRVANLLRDEGLDASSAHIIEAVRLAESLAALRGLSLAGLPELTEATQAVLCFGRREPLELIRRKLIVGERMGAVPPDAPMTPLQRDLYRLQRELLLTPAPEPLTLALDLRAARDHARSRLLHRLNLLGIPWGKRIQTRNQTGTYQENWRLHWLPDFAVRVIEASVWGTTVHAAAEGAARHRAGRAESLPELTALLDEVILADLPETVARIVQQIEDAATLRGDILHMMAALPPLARVLRYGSVRQTDQRVLRHVVDRLLARICIGLPAVCTSLNDEAAAEMEAHIRLVHGVVATLQDTGHADAWQRVLRALLDQPQIPGLLGGRACRILFDGRGLSVDETLRYLERNLSIRRQAQADLHQAAHWLDGFLKGGGLLLIHDHALWSLLDRWIMQLDSEQFMLVAPLLRRTFAGFSESVRRQLGERIRHTASVASVTVPVQAASFDHEAAAKVLPLLAEIVA